MTTEISLDDPAGKRWFRGWDGVSLLVLVLVGMAAACIGASILNSWLDVDRATSEGGILQLFGLLAVARGIQLLLRTTRTTLGSLLRGLKPITGSGQVVLPGTTAEGTGTASAKLGGNTLEDRLDSLEGQVSSLELVIDGLRGEISQSEERSLSRLKDEGERSKERDEGLGRLIEDLSVAGIRLEIVGLAWLVLGTISATWNWSLSSFLIRALLPWL